MHGIYKFCININICELNKHLISVDIEINWDKHIYVSYSNFPKLTFPINKIVYSLH